MSRPLLRIRDRVFLDCFLDRGLLIRASTIPIDFGWRSPKTLDAPVVIGLWLRYGSLRHVCGIGGKMLAFGEHRSFPIPSI